MPELINRQAALEIAMSYCPDDDGCCSKAGHDLREMLDEIEALPTIKAEPVRHGRWECGGFCSECGLDNEERKTTFCPNCGADMREEGADNAESD